MVATGKYIKNLRFILKKKNCELLAYMQGAKRKFKANYTKPAKVKERLQPEDAVWILEEQESCVLWDRRL